MDTISLWPWAWSSTEYWCVYGGATMTWHCATMTLMSESTFKRLWPDRLLQPSTIKLRNNSGEMLRVVGSATKSVCYGAKEAMLPLTIVEGSGPSLIGQNWLSTFPLDWKRIQLVNSALLEVLSRQAAVFANEFLLQLILLPSPDFARLVPCLVLCDHWWRRSWTD